MDKEENANKGGKTFLVVSIIVIFVVLIMNNILSRIKTAETDTPVSVALSRVRVRDVTSSTANLEWQVNVTPGKDGIPEDMEFFFLYSTPNYAPVDTSEWTKFKVEKIDTTFHVFYCSYTGLLPKTDYYVAASCRWGSNYVITETTRFRTEQALQPIDLGLPSGIKWASENITDKYGDIKYFAWGETSDKRNYEWSTYRLGSYDSLLKYCTNSSYGRNGDFDNEVTLDFTDDAAYKLFGALWRIPNMSDWKELWLNCKWEWTKLDGKNGFVVTGPNGKNIFLPADGQKDGTECYQVGQKGFYWSSDLYKESPDLAWSFVFDSSGASYTNSFWFGWEWDYSNTGRRCLGRTIRPVEDPIDI